MGLKLECLEKRLKLQNIADAVYKTLNQTDNLKAEIVLVAAEEIHELNRTTRNVDRVTDVLSYPSLDGVRGKVLKKAECLTELDGGKIFIGSIVLCLDKIREQAKELGHSEKRERDYLIVHGLMHLFGYDHIEEKDKIEMRSKEKQALKLLGIEE